MAKAKKPKAETAETPKSFGEQFEQAAQPLKEVAEKLPPLDSAGIERTVEANSNNGFENVDRTRYYGVRVGDRVQNNYNPGPILYGTVSKYENGDNNRVYVLWDGRTELSGEVAEWLIIIDKIEDLRNGKPVTPTPVPRVQTPEITPEPPSQPVITQQVVTASFKMELSRLKFEEAFNRFAALKVTEDNIPTIQLSMKNARGFLRNMEAIKANGKERALTECRWWDTAFKQLSAPLETQLARLQAELNKVAIEIDRKRQEKARKQQRIADIKSSIDNFILTQSQAIAGTENLDALTAIEKLIGSHKANKSRYDEFLPALIERCEELTPLIKKQKEHIRELEELKARKAEADKKGDDRAFMEIEEQEAAITSQIDENKIRVQEKALEQVTRPAEVVTATPVLPQASARRTKWKAELINDKKSIEKALKADLLEVSLDKEKVEVLINTLKASGQLTDKEEFVINGVRIYLEKLF